MKENSFLQNCETSEPQRMTSLESTRAQIFALAENLRSAERRQEDDALLPAHQDRMPLHRHEVQRGSPGRIY